MPQLQEASGAFCNRGSHPEKLAANPEYAGLDFSRITNDALGKSGLYSPVEHALENRARWCRGWLRAHAERDVVVVGHGAFLSYIADKSITSITEWKHTQVQLFTFECGPGEDGYEDAWLVRVKEGEEEPWGGF